MDYLSALGTGVFTFLKWKVRYDLLCRGLIPIFGWLSFFGWLWCCIIGTARWVSRCMFQCWKQVRVLTFASRTDVTDQTSQRQVICLDELIPMALPVSQSSAGSQRDARDASAEGLAFATQRLDESRDLHLATKVRLASLEQSLSDARARVAADSEALRAAVPDMLAKMSEQWKAEMCAQIEKAFAAFAAKHGRKETDLHLQPSVAFSNASSGGHVGPSLVAHEPQGPLEPARQGTHGVETFENPANDDTPSVDADFVIADDGKVEVHQSESSDEEYSADEQEIIDNAYDNLEQVGIARYGFEYFVRIDGLSCQHDLNGLVGRVLAFHKARNRFEVLLHGRQDAFLLKLENLRRYDPCHSDRCRECRGRLNLFAVPSCDCVGMHDSGAENSEAHSHFDDEFAADYDFLGLPEATGLCASSSGAPAGFEKLQAKQGGQEGHGGADLDHLEDADTRERRFSLSAFEARHGPIKWSA